MPNFSTIFNTSSRRSNERHQEEPRSTTAFDGPGHTLAGVENHEAGQDRTRWRDSILSGFTHVRARPSVEDVEDNYDEPHRLYDPELVLDRATRFDQGHDIPARNRGPVRGILRTEHIYPDHRTIIEDRLVYDDELEDLEEEYLAADNRGIGNRRTSLPLRFTDVRHADPEGEVGLREFLRQSRRVTDESRGGDDRLLPLRTRREQNAAAPFIRPSNRHTQQERPEPSLRTVAERMLQLDNDLRRLDLNDRIIFRPPFAGELEELEDTEGGAQWYEEVTAPPAWVDEYLAPPTRGATQEELSNLPTRRIAENDQGEDGKAECPVCMDEIPLGETVSTMPCGHWYHGDCIKEWLGEHRSCPVCRTELE